MLKPLSDNEYFPDRVQYTNLEIKERIRRGNGYWSGNIFCQITMVPSLQSEIVFWTFVYTILLRN